MFFLINRNDAYIIVKSLLVQLSVGYRLLITTHFLLFIQLPSYTKPLIVVNVPKPVLHS